MKIGFIAVGVLIATATTALAHPSRYDADARQARQTQAIEAGRQSGSITWREGRRLRRDQREIQRAFRDIHAANNHNALTWDVAASLYGKVALGIRIDHPTI